MTGLRELLLHGLAEVEPDAATLIGRYLGAVDTYCGLFQGMHEEKHYYNDDHDLLSVRVDVRPTASLSAGGYRVGPAMIGRTDELDSSAIRALFEGFERYSLSVYDEGHLVKRSAADLDSKSEPHMDVDLVAGILSNQVTKNEMLNWTDAVDLGSGETILVPAQLVYVPYSFPATELQLREPVSTGAAAGLCWAPTLMRALLEVVERDATMLLHYGGLGLDLIAPNFLQGSTELHYRAMLKSGKSVRFGRIQTDVPAHVVVAVVEDPTGKSPAVTVGSCASLSLAAAVDTAFREAATFNRAMRSRLSYAARELSRNGEEVVSGELRGYYWADLARLGALGDWFDGAGYLNDKSLAETADFQPAKFVDYLLELPGGVAIIDYTTSDVASFGVICLKAIVPALQPMHLDETQMTVSRRLQASIMEKPDTRSRIGAHPFL